MCMRALGALPWVAAIFSGLKPAVVAVVVAAVLRIGGKALKTPAMWAVAAVAFGLIFGLGVGFPWNRCRGGAAWLGGLPREAAPGSRPAAAMVEERKVREKRIRLR